MKKLMLAAILTIVGLSIATDALARGCWNRCNRPCATRCEMPCGEPCRPQCPQTYDVVEDVCPVPPVCVKYVPVEGTPICHRVCRWSCPPGYEIMPNEGHGSFSLQGGKESHSY